MASTPSRKFIALPALAWLVACSAPPQPPPAPQDAGACESNIEGVGPGGLFFCLEESFCVNPGRPDAGECESVICPACNAADGRILWGLCGGGCGPLFWPCLLDGGPGLSPSCAAAVTSLGRSALQPDGG